MNTKTFLLTGVGFVLLGVGAVGVFLPILPTTPFVLAASACFAGNSKARAWLLKSSFFRDHITNYQRRSGLKKSTVAISLAFLWGMLGLSVLAIGTWWGLLLLCSVGTAVSVHILCVAKPKT